MSDKLQYGDDPGESSRAIQMYRLCLFSLAGK